MMKKLTVTIGIPAYNEEKTIGKLLRSVQKQTEDVYKIERILIVSDGSSDRTVAIVNSIKDRRIDLIDDHKNLGHVARRNQIMKTCKSDVVIFLDADGVLENNNTLSHLVQPLTDDKKVCVSGGNHYSVVENTFLSHSFAVPRDIFFEVRFQINSGNNVFGCFGGLLAIKREICRKITIPLDIDADDAYIYFACLKNGGKFVCVESARSIQHFPKTIKAHVERNKRHSTAKSDLRKYFGEIVDREYSMPRALYYRTFVKYLVKQPVHTMFVLALNYYSKHIYKYE